MPLLFRWMRDGLMSVPSLLLPIFLTRMSWGTRLRAMFCYRIPPNSYVRSEKKLIATVDVNDLIVVESDDAILVAHKDQAAGCQEGRRVAESVRTS